jgi:hypothetical protein
LIILRAENDLACVQLFRTRVHSHRLQIVMANVAAVEVTTAQLAAPLASSCACTSRHVSHGSLQAVLADRRTPDAASLAVYDSAVQLQDKVRRADMRVNVIFTNSVHVMRHAVGTLKLFDVIV